MIFRQRLGAAPNERPTNERRKKEDMPNDTQMQTSKNKKGEVAPPSVATTAMTAPPETEALAEFDYGEDRGGGFENQDMSDRKLPIIELLQSNSPEVAESKGKVYAGQFRNTVTNEIYEEVFFVPAVTDTCWTEWIPRDDGGGFKGRHPKKAKIVADAIARNGSPIGKLKVPQPPDPKTNRPQPDHELVESREIYGILYNPTDGDILGFAMIPFTSTKIKAYKGWCSSIGNFAPTFYGVKDSTGQSHGQFPTKEAAEKKAGSVAGSTIQPIKFRPGEFPMFGHRVKMTSVSETKGTNTYQIPVLSPAEGGDDLKASILPKTDPRYIEAKKLKDDVISGLANAAYESTKQEPGADPEAGVPF